MKYHRFTCKRCNKVSQVELPEELLIPVGKKQLVKLIGGVCGACAKIEILENLKKGCNNESEK